jgi:hypothetical protein
MKITYLVGIISILLLGCTGCKEAEVIITKDYVINPNWDKVDNAFQVIRMTFKNSGDSINLKNTSQPKLLEKLEEDTSFSYTANIKYDGKKYSERKVFFNKYNGFVWRKPPDIDPSRNTTYKTIGELQQNTWYLLAGLSPYRTLYYVYIDSLDTVHRFPIITSNW